MKRSLLYQVGGGEGVDFERLVREVGLAEELGLDTVWLFPSMAEDGSFRGNAPEVWLGGLATRTSRIRLGWGVGELLPPSEPPMRIAEQAASLDVASEGRLEVALVPSGAIAADGDLDWQEGYRMLVDMWDAPSFSWTSDRFVVRPVDVVPKPVQRPHPALWLAGWSREHARVAGSGGLGYLDLSGGTDRVIEAHHEAYLEGRGEAQPEELVSVHAFAVAADLDPGDDASRRLSAWEALGVDHAVVRVGPLSGGGGEESLRRIRFLATSDPSVH